MSASAINKLSKLYKDECNRSIPYLLKNLNSEHPQVRNYTLKALSQLDISENDLVIVKKVSQNDDKQYNREVANDMLTQYKTTTNDCEQNQVDTSLEVDHITKINTENKVEAHVESNHVIVTNTEPPSNNLKGKMFFSNLFGEIRKDVKAFMDFFKPNTYEVSTMQEKKLTEKVFFQEVQKKEITDEVTFEDVLINKEFITFLEYCNNTGYSFNGSPSKQRQIIIRHKNIVKGIDFSLINDGVNEIIDQYRIFNICDNEIDDYFSLEQELSEELKEEYALLADEFVNLLIEGINKLKINVRDSNVLKLRYNFYGDKVNTLQSIGNEYGITRERVRQIVKKTNLKLTNAYRINANSELYKLKLLTNHLLRPGRSESGKRYVLFLVYGFQSANTRLLIKLLTELIRGRQYEDVIQDTYAEFIDQLNKKIDIERKIQNNNKIFDTRLGNKIQWPERVRLLSEKDYRDIMSVREVNFDNEFYSGDYYSRKMGGKIQFESQLEREVLMLLENSDKVVYYTAQPFNIPYYYFKERCYIPDIFCVLEGGKGVVIEVKPKFHMALDLNFQKYQILKRYCEEKGYGMLVTDKWTSIEEFIEYDYNKDFERELLQRLIQGPIKWSEFLKLKTKYKIGSRDIASIVIKNNLLYYTEPFTISMRKNN